MEDKLLELEETVEDAHNRMEKTIKLFREELSHLRTGRASVSLLDGIKIDYYGTPTPLSQVASITTPSHDLIVIKPWDKTIFKAIEKAILEADLGLNPSDDGEIIRVPVPPLTEETRKNLIKQAHKIAEEHRVKVRGVRHEANDQIKKIKKEGHVSEDDIDRFLDEIQKLTDEFIKKINKILEEKEKELMEI
jgi:ribosome recycling factor